MRETEGVEESDFLWRVNVSQPVKEWLVTAYLEKLLAILKNLIIARERGDDERHRCVVRVDKWSKTGIQWFLSSERIFKEDNSRRRASSSELVSNFLMMTSSSSLERASTLSGSALCSVTSQPKLMS